VLFSAKRSYLDSLLESLCASRPAVELCSPHIRVAWWGDDRTGTAVPLWCWHRWEGGGCVTTFMFRYNGSGESPWSPPSLCPRMFRPSSLGRLWCWLSRQWYRVWLSCCLCGGLLATTILWLWWACLLNCPLCWLGPCATVYAICWGFWQFRILACYCLGCRTWY
jgi:hypothetical protein